MAVTINYQSNSNIESMIKQALDTGQVSRQDHFQLVTLFLNDQLISDLERMQINSLFDEVQLGRIKFLD